MQPTPAIGSDSQTSVGAHARRALAWILVYVGVIAFPLLVLWCGEMPPGGGGWWDFAVALGFGGLAIMVLQAVLTARFRRATAPFGVDVIYYFHRLVAVGGFVLLVGHYGILRLRYAGALGPLDPRSAPWPMTAGRISLLLFGVLVVSSLWRKTLRIEYDRWRLVHALMATVAVGLALAHIVGIGRYTRAWGEAWIWGLYAAAWVLVVGYVRGVRPWRLLNSPYRVTEVRPERGRCWTLTLAPEGHAGLRFEPGQFAWLTLRASPFQAKEHPFSFSGSASDAPVLRFTIKELGDFTGTIGTIKAGEIAYVDGPHGVFTTDRGPAAPGFVFIAGGIGIAPIMSMLRTLADRGDRRPLRLIHGGRRWEDLTFREEIELLRARLNLVVDWVLQEVPAEWSGVQGVLSPPVLRAAIPPDARECTYFVCGPKAMSESVQLTLRSLGVPINRIHFELFDMA